MLCDAFCSHTALPRVKGMHQPRDSAVFFSTYFDIISIFFKKKYLSISPRSGAHLGERNLFLDLSAIRPPMELSTTKASVRKK